MKKIETISYKGYKIEIISDSTALVVCKRCKGKYIPYFSEEGCKTCIDDIKSRISTERGHILWDEETREKTIEREAKDMKTYYIEIEEQCSMVLALIKVEAENEEEAKLKALKALHATQDIYSITQEEAQNLIDSGEIDYMLDEDGCEIGVDEEDQ